MVNTSEELIKTDQWDWELFLSFFLRQFLCIALAVLRDVFSFLSFKQLVTGYHILQAGLELLMLLV